MRRWLRLGGLLLLGGFAGWLFFEEQAAKPGPLLDFHAQAATCLDCHVPWQGVGTAQCLGCHRFAAEQDLAREIRFHRAERLCLGCHREHRGARADIASMDHTLLHPDLQCSQCHFDPHEGLFGEACRACHGITSWRIKGYRHPSDQSSCARCHRPPLSHEDPLFWRSLATHYETLLGEAAETDPQQCWHCHVPHDWSHLRQPPE